MSYTYSDFQIRRLLEKSTETFDPSASSAENSCFARSRQTFLKCVVPCSYNLCVMFTIFIFKKEISVMYHFLMFMSNKYISATLLSTIFSTLQIQKYLQLILFFFLFHCCVIIQIIQLIRANSNVNFLQSYLERERKNVA